MKPSIRKPQSQPNVTVEFFFPAQHREFALDVLTRVFGNATAKKEDVHSYWYIQAEDRVEKRSTAFLYVDLPESRLADVDTVRECLTLAFAGQGDCGTYLSNF